MSYVALCVSGERRVRCLASSGIPARARIMGLLLAVIGIQMALEGLRGAVGPMLEGGRTSVSRCLESSALAAGQRIPAVNDGSCRARRLDPGDGGVSGPGRPQHHRYARTR
jgi:hypothetical protein